MPLSKERNRARMRNIRLLKSGKQPSATEIIEPLSENQRKERLASLIATPIEPDKINPSHIISAIDIYNKMTKTYVPEQQNTFQDNRQYQIIISAGTDAKEQLQNLLKGDIPQLEQTTPKNEDLEG